MAKTNNTNLVNTGERMIPEFSKGSLEYGEHIVRYLAAQKLVKGRTVLDIASGSGYGTAMLAAIAKKVIGVDYSQDAVDYAAKNFGSSNTSFIQGDATNIPLKDNSVDMVVSFETLEHIDEYEKFMSEISRVLKDDGLLILSTPNDVEFPEGAHYHIHEFEKQELEKLVKKYFKSFKSYYQVTWKYNALLEESQIGGESEINIPTKNLAPVDTTKALYFYMLCANRTIKESILPVGALSEHWSTRDMLEHNASIDKYIRKTIKHFRDIIAEKDKQILHLQKRTVAGNSRRVKAWLKSKRGDHDKS